MGLFDFFKRKKPINKNQVTNVFPENPNKRLSKEDYASIRQDERDWFESHYDLSTIAAISQIPEQKDLPHPPGDSATGEIYYYLRYKAHVYEHSGEIALAIACMRKSISLMRVKYGEWYGYNESQSLVYLLARNGYTEEAKAEQENLDAHYTSSMDRMRLTNFNSVLKTANEIGTDLLFMHVLGSTCPECAKYHGRVYSISGTSKIFPPLPEIVKKIGAIHPGCHHSFSPYTQNVSRIDMEYIKKTHPLKNPKFAKNIITFSNRPFTDDRTDECKRAAEISRIERARAKYNKQRRDELIYQGYLKQQADYAEYNWLLAHFPDHCPSTATGYRRMKTQNTKNYQILKKLSAELGKEI